jgi:glycosyltransferase involved in cell wall biosynthesis
VIVHFVVPEGIDDPMRPSGGNVYDRRLSDELLAAGWKVHEHPVAEQPGLAPVIGALPDGATVLVDGLVGAASEAMVAEAARLRLVLLLHMPVAERKVLHAVTAVVTTSGWTRRWVVTRHGLDAERVYVATPGVDAGPRVTGTAAGGNLLCVGPVTPDKGYDVLLDALGEVKDLDWRCVCVGALGHDPAFVDRLVAAAARSGIADRVAFRGPLSRSELDDVRSATDLVVSASRREAFGMAVAEGLARGIPVLATSVGGHPEAVGRADDGSVPGLLVPVGDAGGLASALRVWLTDAALRERMRRSAARRRTSLTTWPETARTVGDVVTRVASLNRTPPVPVSPTSRDRSEG